MIAAGLVTGVVWLDMRSAVTDTGHNPSAEEPDVPVLETSWETQIGDSCQTITVTVPRLDGETAAEHAARFHEEVAAYQAIFPPK